MKKLICIIISICLACAAFAGCGKKDDGMDTLKSNIAVIKTSDGRTGTAVILDDGSLLAPSHLVDYKKGMTYTVQYPGGMEAQAEIFSNDVYSDVAILSPEVEEDDQPEPGYRPSNFRKPKNNDELKAVSYDSAGRVKELYVTLIKTEDRDGVSVLILRGDFSSAASFTGAPIVDENGTIFGIFMAGDAATGDGVGISGGSLQDLLKDLRDNEGLIEYTADDTRSSVITDVIKDEFDVSESDARRILKGREDEWISAETTEFDTRFSVSQGAGPLIRVRYECLSTDPAFELVIGPEAFCYSYGVEHPFMMAKTYIRGGEEGEILLYFPNLERVSGMYDIDAVAFRALDGEVYLDFTKPVIPESQSAAPTGESPLQACSAMLKDFMESNEDMLIWTHNYQSMQDLSEYQYDYTSAMMVDDMNNDGLPDLLYTVVDDLQFKTYMLIYDNGELAGPFLVMTKSTLGSGGMDYIVKSGGKLYYYYVFEDAYLSGLEYRDNAVADTGQVTNNIGSIIDNSDWMFSSYPMPHYGGDSARLMSYDEVMDYLNSLLGSEASGEDGSVTAAKVMRSFLESKKNTIWTLLIDDVSGDGIDDLIYTDKRQDITSLPGTTGYNYYTHILVYDSGRMIEPDNISYYYGSPCDFAEKRCAFYYTGLAATEGSSAMFIKSGGKLYVRITDPFENRQTLIHYEYNDGSFEELESIYGESIYKYSYSPKDSDGPNDRKIDAIWADSDWTYYNNPEFHLSSLADGKDRYISYEQAIAYLDGIIG